MFCNIALKVSTHLKLALKKHTDSVALSNNSSIKICSHVARGYIITQNAIVKISDYDITVCLMRFVKQVIKNIFSISPDLSLFSPSRSIK